MPSKSLLQMRHMNVCDVVIVMQKHAIAVTIWIIVHLAHVGTDRAFTINDT